MLHLTSLRSCSIGSASLSHPDEVLSRFIRRITEIRKQRGLSQEETTGICDVAIKQFRQATSADTQVKWVHLITATHSQAGINQLEQVSFDYAHGDWVKQVILDALAELYEFVQ